MGLRLARGNTPGGQLSDMTQAGRARPDGLTVEDARPSSSRRSADTLRAQVDVWLKARPDITQAKVTELSVPETNGMSSETIMVTASWAEAGQATPMSHPLVFRLAPDLNSMPIFESYDLELQFNLMRDVAAASDVPIPRVIWYESDRSHVGSEFFVMQRCDGEVPADVLPYNFGDSFLFDAPPEDQVRLQRSSVQLLAELHAVDDPISRFPYLATAAGIGSGDSSELALRNLVTRMRAHYEYVSSDGRRSSLIEKAFDWVEAHWSDLRIDQNPVLLWGDSRIGNVLYRDFEPAGVLDWEMATIGPRELDVSWMIFMHQFFEDVAHQLDLPGMPEFMRAEEVIATYSELTGHTLANMDFFAVISALQHAIIMSQVGRRATVFGDGILPEDINDLIMHRRLLSAYMA